MINPGLPPPPEKTARLRKEPRQRTRTVAPPREDGTVLVGSQVPRDVAAAIEVLARSGGKSKNAWVRDLILAAAAGQVPAVVSDAPPTPQDGIPALTGVEVAALIQCLADRGGKVPVKGAAVDCAASLANPVAVTQPRPGFDEYEVSLSPDAARLVMPTEADEPAEKHRGTCGRCKDSAHAVRRVRLGGMAHYWCLPCRKAQGVKSDHPDGDPEVREIGQGGPRHSTNSCPRCRYRW